MVRTAILLLSILAVVGCTSKPRIVVGSKNFTEQVLLGEILAQQIERRTGIAVERKLNLGGTLLAHEAMRSGAIDLYPEYTGTALTAILKQAPDKNRKTVLDRVRAGYREWSIEWLDPLGFDNTFAMVVRSDVAKRQQLRTLTDAAARKEPWRLGVGYEFVQRPDGLDGLVRAYSLRLEGKPATMDLGLLYPALRTERIDMGAASATDGQLAQSDFAVLVDDKAYFPPYESAIVVRRQILDQHGELRPALQMLSGRITASEMRRMNAAVDIKHRSVAEVAGEFLGKLTGGGDAK